MKATLIVGLIVIAGAAATAAVVPSVAPVRGGEQIDVPKMLLVGEPGTSGEVRVVVNYKGFPMTPNVDVHTKASGVEFRRLDVSGGGAGSFHFTLSYNALTPKSFWVDVLIHDGTAGTGGNHYDRDKFEVRRR